MTGKLKILRIEVDGHFHGSAELDLRVAGWEIIGLSTMDRPRRPLLLPGERLGQLLDGARSDERGQGFAARRGTDLLVSMGCTRRSPRSAWTSFLGSDAC